MISPSSGLILLLLSSITFGFSNGQDTKLLVVESCLPNGGDLFSLFSTAVNFDKAKAICSDLDGSLARISSVEEFNHVQNLIASPTFDFWIGVVDSDRVGRDETTRFSFVDESTENLTFIHTEVGKFPWKSSEPNNFDAAGEFCVEWLKDDNRWNDQVCSDGNGVLCRRSCPAVEPTSQPAQNPTLAPTAKESSEENFPSSSIALLSVAGISSVGLGICITLVLKEKKKVKSLTADLLKVKVAQL